MSLKRSTPGEGGEVRAEQFAYTPPAAGLKGSYAAWCACEPYWCRVHEHTKAQPGTKPCLTWLTNGEVPCPRCRPATVPTQWAYVLMWREADLKPVLVLCPESTSDLLADLSFGVFVVVGRVDAGSGVHVRRAEVQREWRSSLPCRQAPVDSALTLLTLWGIPALDQWYAGQKRRERERPAAGPIPAKHRLSVPPPTSKVEAQAIDAEKKAADGWAAMVDATLGAAMVRVAKPSTNGKHHPKPKGEESG